MALSGAGTRTAEGRVSMAAPAAVFTIARVANMLGEDEDYSKPQVSWDRHSRNVGRRQRHPER